MYSKNFHKCIMACTHYYNILQSSFADLGTLSAVRLVSYASLTTSNHWSFHFSIVLAFPERDIFGIIQHVGFPNWLLSLGNMCLGLLHVFWWYDQSYILIPKNMPSFGCTTFYSFTYRRTSWLFPSFGNQEQSHYKHSSTGFLYRYKFSTSLNKYKEE